MFHNPGRQSHASPARPLLAMAIAASLFAGAAEAGKPKGAKNADPKTIIKFYAGHTTEWTNGWVYWAPNGQMRIYWNNRDKSYGKNSVAVGAWSVDGRGRQCYQATWYSRKTGSKTTTEFEAKKTCREHVVDPEGNLWARDKHSKEYNDWWELKHDLKRMKKGETKRSAFRSLAKKFGVSY